MSKTIAWLLALAALLVSAPGAAAEEDATRFGFPVGTGVFAEALTVGPDGNIWFAANGHRNYSTEGTVVGKISLSGDVTEYKLPGFARTSAIVAGPDGNLWFTGSETIRRITPTGEATSFRLPKRKSWPSSITTGPDGALWFTEGRESAIGRITTAGQITEFPLARGRHPSGIVAGPDGALWFTERGAPRIGRITVDGKIREFPVPGTRTKLDSIALGPDGNLWFGDEAAPRVGRITPNGQVKFFYVPTAGGTRSIIAGPNGLIWFASAYEVGAISPTGVISWPSCLSEGCAQAANALVTAPDGSLWVGAGVADCIGLCGGGTELLLPYTERGGIGPYQLPPLTLAIGPRLAKVRNGRTSVLLACGEAAGCRGELRLGFVEGPSGERRLKPFATSDYDLATGASERIQLSVPTETLERISGDSVFPVATAGPPGAVLVRQEFIWHADQHRLVARR